MPITINGSTGISGVDGSAGTPALIGSDADTGIFLAAGQVSASVNGTAGNVPLVSGTAQASTSGTSIDFTGIPSWVKRVTVMFQGVSTNGTSPIIFQLGTSSGFVTSGYFGSGLTYNTTGANGTAFSNVNGIRVRDSNAAADAWNGEIRFSNINSNTWVSSGSFESSAGSGVGMCGTTFLQTLSGALDRIRITTVVGTSTFDGGTINIMYE